MASRVPPNGATPPRAEEPRREDPSLQEREERVASAAGAPLRSLAEATARLSFMSRSTAPWLHFQDEEDSSDSDDWSRTRENPTIVVGGFTPAGLYTAPLTDTRPQRSWTDDRDEVEGLGITILREFTSRLQSRTTDDVRSSGVARRLFAEDDPADLAIAETFDDSLHAASLHRDAAVRTNQDGGAYLEAVVLGYLETLSETEKKEFEDKLIDCDPEIFFIIPRLAVGKALSSKDTLTRNNTPKFMHRHLAVLKELVEKRLDDATPTPEKAMAIRNQFDTIVTALARQEDCIASIQNAMERLMKKSEQQSSEKS